MLSYPVDFLCSTAKLNHVEVSTLSLRLCVVTIMTHCSAFVEPQPNQDGIVFKTLLLLKGFCQNNVSQFRNDKNAFKLICYLITAKRTVPSEFTRLKLQEL